jgi:hypothetical protein
VATPHLDVQRGHSDTEPRVLTPQHLDVLRQHVCHDELRDAELAGLLHAAQYLLLALLRKFLETVQVHLR